MLKKVVFFVFSLFFFSAYSTNWVNTDKEAIYLFAPGIHAGERHVAPYCTAYKSSTGEIAFADNDFSVLGTCVKPIIFPEIKESTATQTANPGHNASAVRSLFNLIYNFISINRLKVTQELNRMVVETNNHIATIAHHDVVASALNIGQEGDIETLSVAYDTLVAMAPEKDVVLYGFSRGSATIFSFMATQYAHKKIKNVKAIVLESCFDSVQSIVAHKFPFFWHNKYTNILVRKIFGFVYPAHDLDGIAPIKVVEQFPLDIPVLFVTSKVDTVVPAECTYTLYHALQNAGHQNIHFLELKHSSHPAYPSENEYDKLFYESAVHAFYKKYNLPYNPKKIVLGDVILAGC